MPAKSCCAMGLPVVASNRIMARGGLLPTTDVAYRTRYARIEAHERRVTPHQQIAASAGPELSWRTLTHRVRRSKRERPVMAHSRPHEFVRIRVSFRRFA